MTQAERFHVALLLAGARAALSGGSVCLSTTGEGFELATSRPAGTAWLRVTPAGDVFGHRSRKGRGELLGNLHSDTYSPLPILTESASAT